MKGKMKGEMMVCRTGSGNRSGWYGCLQLGLAVAAAFGLCACAGGRKLEMVNRQEVTALVSAGESAFDRAREMPRNLPERLQEAGPESPVLNAEKDERTGEMVATDVLDAVVVQAAFKHVAERNGAVDVAFEVTVPQELLQSRWQVRFTPQFRLSGDRFLKKDTLQTEKIYITGARFRSAQEWGYRMYGNYLSGVLPDAQADSIYVYSRLLDRFVRRNGLQSRAEEHYRKAFLLRSNRRRRDFSPEIYRQFVKDSIATHGIRLDSVVKAGNGILRYCYVQTLDMVPGLKRIDMSMSGDLHAIGKKLCSLRPTHPVTFYVTSISTFADKTPRYLTKVIRRDLHLNTIYNIGFRKGESRIDSDFADNAAELEELRGHLRQVQENADYVLDSVAVEAACSPEGSSILNRKLSGRRGEAVKDFIAGMLPQNCISVRELGEDWETLRQLVQEDTLAGLQEVLLPLWQERHPDERELQMRRSPFYAYVSSQLYPRLRRVKLDLKLRRKGMLRDTVHTRELDTLYRAGVQALESRDYKSAAALLRPYRCLNTAIAYTCLNLNHSALELLEELPADAKRDYLLAVVLFRLGEEARAAEHFRRSVAQDEKMKYRANLDPEISALIKKYKFNNNF